MTMRLLRWLPIAVALTTAAGCDLAKVLDHLAGNVDLTLFPVCESPLYSADVLISEPSLEGVWQGVWVYDKTCRQKTYFHDEGPHAAPTVSFTKTGNGRYDFVYLEPGSRITGVAHLVKLSQQHRHHYLDLEIRDGEGDLCKAFPSVRALPPLHLIRCVGIKDDHLADAPIDMSWMNDVAESDGFAIRTASTDRLQELLHRHGEELGSSLYSQTVYRRKPSSR